MISDEDRFRHRPRESTARQKRWEKCVWMVENWAEWASGYGQFTKIELSDSCVGKTITARYNLGMIAMNLNVIWGMSAKIEDGAGFREGKEASRDGRQGIPR